MDVGSDNKRSNDSSSEEPDWPVGLMYSDKVSDRQTRLYCQTVLLCQTVRLLTRLYTVTPDSVLSD